MVLAWLEVTEFYLLFSLYLSPKLYDTIKTQARSATRGEKRGGEGGVSWEKEDRKQITWGDV